MLGSEVGEEEADGDRQLLAVRLARGDEGDQVVERRLRERHEHRSIVPDPLGDAVAIAPADERRRLAPVQVVELFLVETADEGDVLKPGGGDEEHPRAAPLQQRVGGDGGADDHTLHLSVGGIDLGEDRAERPRRVVGGRRLLAIDERGVVIDRRQDR